MRVQSEKKHTIDLLFPFALFFVLAASSLIVVLLASRIYQKNIDLSQDNYESRTALSYVCEKVRQSDERGAVSLDTFDGQDALALRQTYNGQLYYTYIYEYDGYLRELFIGDGVSANAADGRPILAVHNFKITEISKRIFEISYTDKEGNKVSTAVAVKSEP